jgi:pyruvate kinase
MVAAGMDVARLNLSHGSHEEHAAACEAVRKAAVDAGRTVSVLADLQGPKIRVGTFEPGPAVLESGASITLTDQAVSAGDGGSIPLRLPGRLSPGDVVLIDDGRVKLCAESGGDTAVRCRVVEGGVVSDHKGVNVPGVELHDPRLTAKDDHDLRFALDLGVDAVAMSFVRSGDDARAVREIMEGMGHRVPVVAKVERRQAVAEPGTLDGILECFDGVMVARGDLGVEVPMERVPMVQKRLVALARRHAKPVIVATQMLESMVGSSQPTRAEVSDVANAVLDGADALMLSAETGVGDHPVGAVAIMDRVVAATESEQEPAVVGDLSLHPPLRREEALAHAAHQLSTAVGARVVVAVGPHLMARRLASYRSPVPVLALTADAGDRRTLALTWGVEAVEAAVAGPVDDLLARVDGVLRDTGFDGAGPAVVAAAPSLLTLREPGGGW